MMSRIQIQRLDVLFERRTAEQADLGDVRRAVARQTALAFDQLDHRQLFAADIGAGAAAQMQLGMRRQTRGFDLGDLLGQHQPQLGIFVADIEISLRRLDHPGGDQHALDEAVRIALEIMAVLEGAGLALVGVDREHARGRLGAHQRPFAPGGKSGAAEAAQAGVADDLDQLIRRALAVETILEQRIAAGFLIGGEIGFGVPGMRMRFGADRGGDVVGGRVEGLQVADGNHRRMIAGAHAGRAQHAHVLAQFSRQRGQELLGAGHGAG